jgi:AbiV family abortive infection protein
LPDILFYEVVATGVRHLIEVIDRLDAAAHKLSKSGDHHAARIIALFAVEESAKILILLDAVRCPSARGVDKSRTLGYFYDHLAKSIYGEVSGWRPADFAEVTRGIEDARAAHYLDGPNDVDWILPNQLTQRREDELYVGFVRDDTEAAGDGECYWTCPRNEELISYWTPPAVVLGRALHAARITSSAGLAAVAEIWRKVELYPETRFDELERLNLLTLETLNSRGILPEIESNVCVTVRDCWPFPLWPLDLRQTNKKADRDNLKEQLRRVRQNWTP